MKSQPSSSGFKLAAWQVILFATILTGAAIWHTVNVFKGFYTVVPEKIYAEAFQEPVAHVSDLTGGGKLGGYFDLWLHFKCGLNDMHLNKANEFEKMKNITEPVRWFSDKYPDTNILSADINTVECFYRTHREAAQIKNEWMLHNAKSTDYFYRTWGY